MSTANYMITNGDGTITASGMTWEQAQKAAKRRQEEHGEPFFVAMEGYESADDEDIGEPEATERLTDDMIRQLRTEAAAAGDTDQVKSCDAALRGGFLDSFSRAQCAAVINAARGMDDSKPFVRLIP